MRVLLVILTLLLPLTTFSPVLAKTVEQAQAASRQAETLLEAISGDPVKAPVSLPHPDKRDCISTCQSLLLKDRQDSSSIPSSTASILRTDTSQLLVLVSQSMPETSIQGLWQQAYKIGARLVFRGLIDDSFKNTQDYMTRLGIIADIDPNPFADYQVKSVPTFILADKGKVDRVAGHICLSEALAQFQASGDLKDQARYFTQKLTEKSA